MKLKRLKKDFEILSVPKARIIAHLIGDGSVYKSNNDYNIKYEVKDPESLNSFEQDMMEVYGLKLTKGWHPSGFTGKLIPFVRLRSKLVYEDLLNFASYKSQNWEIKNELTKSSKEIKKEFLKAFFDDEGSVIVRNKRVEVRIYSINLKGLMQIRDILLEFELESRIVPGYGERRNVFAIILKNPLKFKNEIGSGLQRKQVKLESL